MKKNILLYVAVLLFPLGMQAQINFVSSPVTARGGANNALATNWEAIGVNPSNLGWSSNNDFTASLLNVGFSAQADQLTIPNIGKMTSGDTNLLKQVAASPGGVNIYASIIWAAFSFKVPVVGTFALSLDDKAYGNISPSPGFLNVSDFQTAYAGIASTVLTPQTAQAASKNVSVTKGADSALDLNNLFSSYNGSKVSFYEYRELSLSYGREMFKLGKGGDPDDSVNNYNAFKFYGGVGIKYIMGIANLIGEFNNGTITADYAAVPSNQEFSLFPSGAPGQGYSVDLGVSMAYQNWKFALSVTDLGSISWKGTHATLSDTAVVNRILRDKLDSNSSNTNISSAIQTSSESYTTQLPSKLRLGASYMLNIYFTFASDIIVPLNDAPGNLTDPYYSIATRITPVKMLTFDLGLATCKGYGLAIPFGFTVGHRVQFYLGINDVLSLAGKTKQDDLSAAVGLLRINL